MSPPKLHPQDRHHTTPLFILIDEYHCDTLRPFFIPFTLRTHTHKMAATAIASSSSSAAAAAAARTLIVVAARRAQSQTSSRAFGTGSRGSRGLGWYTRYRDGRGGRHLQGKYWDRNVKELQEINDTVFRMGSLNYYLDLQVGDGAPLLRLELELATAALPLTCQNFTLLGDDGQYDNTIVHKIEKGVGLCLGDTQNKKGRGGACHESLSPYGSLPETEPLVLSHLPGIVTMVCPGVDRVDSRFMVCTNEAPHLDGTFVAFGRLLDLEIVKDLEETQYTTRGLPNVDIKIVGCGPLNDNGGNDDDGSTTTGTSDAA